jgi:16S rRNA (uracil1498-N3)-methyltransferase
MIRSLPKHRFHVAGEIHEGSEIPLTRDQASQITRVLRLGAGDAITVFNGDGYDYRATLRTSGRRLLGIPSGEREPALNWGQPDAHLGLALLKSDRFDLVIQKAVELGVTRITPLNTERCVVSLPVDRARQRIERWRRVAREALEQCGRADRVDIVPPADFAEFLAMECSDLRVLAWESEDGRDLSGSVGPTIGTVALAIGPEGGFTDDEVRLARSAGFQIVSLGPVILRSETAAIAALAMIRALSSQRASENSEDS